MEEHEVARLANEAQYATRDPLHGSPHLNHTSVWSIYVKLVKRALAAVGPKPRVLDLGAGEGTALLPWLEGGATVTAVDDSAVLLRRLREKHPAVETVKSDALEYVSGKVGRFDVVSHVSMLHHIPDYMTLLKASARAVRPGGALLTFEDPLRYDRLPAGHHLAFQLLYIPWRLSEGNVIRGIGNRLRHMRGIYLADNPDDLEEYHVKRNGVDSDAIAALLGEPFESVEVARYFSIQSRLGQWIGEHARLQSTFCTLATGRRESDD